MKTNRVVYLIFLIAVSFSGCKKTKACLDKETYTVKVNEKVKIKSCSENADVYDWQVDGMSVGSSFDDIYKVFDGGDDCDDFLEIAFKKKGTYTILMNAAKLKDGSCDGGSYESTFGKDIEAVVTVN